MSHATCVDIDEEIVKNLKKSKGAIYVSDVHGNGIYLYWAGKRD